MEISQTLLGLMFALAAITGAGLGLLWNVLRLIRALCGVQAVTTSGARAGVSARPPRCRLSDVIRTLWLTLLDIVFGLLCGCALILLLYYTNDGQFRLLAVAGMGCGFFVWHYTLGALIGRMTDALVRTLRRLFRWILRGALWLVLWPPSVIRRLWRATIGKRIQTRRLEKRRKMDLSAVDAWFRAQTERAARGFDAEGAVPPDHEP